MHSPSGPLSPQGLAYLYWLQDRGFHGYALPATPLKLLFLCEGDQLTLEHHQLLQRMGQAVGISPSQSQFLCIRHDADDTLRMQIRQLRPICTLILGKYPNFLSTLLTAEGIHMELTWSLPDLLREPQRKKDTWIALQALQKHWFTPTM